MLTDRLLFHSAVNKSVSLLNRQLFYFIFCFYSIDMVVYLENIHIFRLEKKGPLENAEYLKITHHSFYSCLLSFIKVIFQELTL